MHTVLVKSRGTAPLLGAVALALGLTGCSPITGGIAGVAVGSDGNPIGVIQVCSPHSIDTATLETFDAHGVTRQGAWSASSGARGSTSWSLRDGGDGWSVTTPLAKLVPGVTYEFSGSSRDQSTWTIGVQFTTRDLSAMKPGQVRYVSAYMNKNLESTVSIVSLAEFEKSACELLK